MKTVAVIGAGVSGLATACFLSRKGVRVKVFEANDKVGGCCSNTRIEGYTFHDGAIYLAIPSMLDHAFGKLGLDREKLLPLRRISRHKTVLPDGSVIYLGDRSITSGARGPAGGTDLGRFLERWEPVLRFFADDILLRPFSLPRFLAKGWIHLPKLAGTVASELKKTVADPTVRSAMSGALLYTGAPPDKNPAASLLGLAALLAEGFYLPEGGMGRIPEVLEGAVAANGGEIHLRSRVKKIMLKSNAAAGIEVEGQGVVEADAIVSTITAMATFSNLLDEKEVPDAIKRKIKNCPLSHRGLAVQLGLANRIAVDSHSTHVLPMMDEQYKALAPEEGDLSWPVYSVPTVTCPELARPGGSIVEMFPPVEQGIHVDYWDEAKKEKVIDLAVDKLSRLHKIDVVVKRGISPRDFRDRLHLYQGALYGLSPSAGPAVQFRHLSAIPGLYLAGQTTYPGYGVGPSAMSGIFAAQAVLEKNN